MDLVPTEAPGAFRASSIWMRRHLPHSGHGQTMNLSHFSQSGETGVAGLIGPTSR